MNADYGEGSGPQQLPRLLTRIGRQAQRVFDGPPWLMSVLRAAVFLAGYGAIWLLVRGKHPYRGPNTAVFAVVFTAVVIATKIPTTEMPSPYLESTIPPFTISMLRSSPARSMAKSGKKLASTKNIAAVTAKASGAANSDDESRQSRAPQRRHKSHRRCSASPPRCI